MSIRSEIEKQVINIHNCNVLDVGCGDGQYKDLFIVNDNKYIGIDVEISGRDETGKKADVFFNGYQIPFENEYFDVVLCTQVLEHAERYEELIKEIYRVLKPDGVVIISVPFIWGEHEVPYDFRRFTSFGIKKLLTDNGFSIEYYKKLDEGVLGIKKIINSEITNYLRSNNLNRGWSIDSLCLFFAKFFLLLFVKSINRVLVFERVFIDNFIVCKKIVDKE